MAAVLIAAPSALATYPGANGKLGFMRPVGEAFYDDIFSVNLDGSGLANLTHNGANNVHFKWSPDGRKIAFESDGDGLDNYYDLYIVNADGSRLRKVSDTGDAGPFDWSPDSAKIVFADGTHVWTLWTVNADGTGLRQITDGVHTYMSPAWSPDGRKIAVERSLDWPDVEIYTINPDGTGETPITDSPLGEGHPAWSPDSRKVAFVAGAFSGCQPAGGCPAIYTVNADGGGWTQLTPDTVTSYEASWSPDGSRLAFVGYRGVPGPSDVYTINADGTDERNLTRTETTEWGQVWSPDGTRLAFLRPEGYPDNGIHVVNADGSGDGRVVTAGDQLDWQPLVRSVFRNGSAYCRAQREASGKDDFRSLYGHNAMRNCIRRAAQ
jgi:Tol biopolymer transport system component